MLTRSRVWFWCLPLLGVSFAGGILWLFNLRFAAGDIYPPSSSFRADPLGTKALRESLAALPGLRASPHLRPWTELPSGRDAALWVLGLRAEAATQLAERDVQALEQFLQTGGRVVVAYRPITSAKEAESAGIRPALTGSTGAREPAKAAPRRSRGPTAPTNELRHASLSARWGWRHAYRELPRNAAGAFAPLAVQRQQAIPLPETLPWHSGVVFGDLRSDWAVVYSREADPVVVERSYGLGSIVLCSDAYLFSNEALQRDRQPEFLAWLAAGARTFYFDEQHHGIAERPGVAALVRRYRLLGLVAGGALLAVLFLWKNASPLVPPRDPGDAGNEEIVLGRDATAGFVNLLRRSVAPSELLTVCLAEWNRSLGRAGQGDPGRAEHAAALVSADAARPPRNRDPVGTYCAVARALGDRSRTRKAEPPSIKP